MSYSVRVRYVLINDWMTTKGFHYVLLVQGAPVVEATRSTSDASSSAAPKPPNARRHHYHGGDSLAPKDASCGKGWGERNHSDIRYRPDQPCEEHASHTLAPKAMPSGATGCVTNYGSRACYPTCNFTP